MPPRNGGGVGGQFGLCTMDADIECIGVEGSDGNRIVFGHEVMLGGGGLDDNHRYG